MSIMSRRKTVIISPVHKTLHASNISISKTLLINISYESASALVSSEPVKSFVMFKSVRFSNFNTAKNFTSDKYCSATCVKHSVNFSLSVVRKFIVSYKTACPVHLNIVIQAVNVTYLCIYCCLFQNTLLHHSHSQFPFRNFHYIKQSHLQHFQLIYHHHQLHHHFKYQKPFSLSHHHHHCYYHHLYLHHRQNLICFIPSPQLAS